MTSQYPSRSLVSLLDSHLGASGASRGHSSRHSGEPTLSQQKLAAARWACELGTDLVFLDEPTAGLGVLAKQELISLINAYSAATFILATHDDALRGVGDEIPLSSQSR
jgi:ABC-type lipoprotein export system ATPase subunit